jgi:hypothetical protein
MSPYQSELVVAAHVQKFVQSTLVKGVGADAATKNTGRLNITEG